MAARVHQITTNVFDKLVPSKSFSLSTHQHQAITGFITGRDAFVSFFVHGKGHGKSLIYQLAKPFIVNNAFQNRYFHLKKPFYR